MAFAGLQEFKASNERKTVFLVLMFPILLFFCFWVAMAVSTLGQESLNMASRAERFDVGLKMTKFFFPVVLVVVVIWGVIVFFFQKQLMFKFAGAKELTRKENPELYNVVENLCISRGLPIPKIWIIPTPGRNAFATGWRMSDSWIVFTEGLVNALDKREIEAVAAHELTHLINKDSLLMLVAVVFVGVISLVGEVLIRVKAGGNSKDDKGGAGLFLVGLAFLVLGYVVYPLIKLSISRKREFLADAGAVELTKDNDAMISALRKISGNSFLPKAEKNIASFFIDSPWINHSDWHSPYETQREHSYEKRRTLKKSSIWDSHPSIEERIAVLQQV